MDFNEYVERFKALEASFMELQKDKIERDAIERYKKERFVRWKDIAIVACAAASAIFSGLVYYFK